MRIDPTIHISGAGPDRAGLSAGRWARRWGWLAFWMSVTAFLTFWFGRSSGHYGQSLLFVALLLPVAMATTWLVGEVLVPRFLLRGRYLLFALYTLYAVIGAVYLELVVLVVAFIAIAGYDASALDPATLDTVSLVVGLFMVVFLFLTIRLVERWHALRAAHERVARMRAEAELRLREAELDMLRGQIHPHVLFNSLNNLYGLTLERSEAAPETVLRLADLLEYMLYRGRAEFVPLHEEVDILRTYAALETLRIDRPVDIRIGTEDVPDGTVVPPLLLLPLVENAFKHGIRRGADRLEVRVRGVEGRLRCEVQNPVPTGSASPEGPGGIGLTNVRRRLELLYRDDHRLRIDHRDDVFHVSIEIPFRP